MDDLKLKIILVILVAVAFLGGFFIYRKVSQSSIANDQSLEPIPVYVPSPALSVSPTPSPRIPEVKNGATSSATASTKGGQKLPATGAPIALIGIFAAGALASGIGLRKFPE